MGKWKHEEKWGRPVWPVWGNGLKRCDQNKPHLSIKQRKWGSKPAAI